MDGCHLVRAVRARISHRPPNMMSGWWILSLSRAKTEVVPALVAPNGVVESYLKGGLKGFMGGACLVLGCLVLEGGCDVDKWSAVLRKLGDNCSAL